VRLSKTRESAKSGYQLVRQNRDIGERVFDVRFLAPGVAAFAFTFG
jgi:hypothetical protein